MYVKSSLLMHDRSAVRQGDALSFRLFAIPAALAVWKLAGRPTLFMSSEEPARRPWRRWATGEASMAGRETAWTT
jgi:hypothetical protein